MIQALLREFKSCLLFYNGTNPVHERCAALVASWVAHGFWCRKYFIKVFEKHFQLRKKYFFLEVEKKVWHLFRFRISWSFDWWCFQRVLSTLTSPTGRICPSPKRKNHKNPYFKTETHLSHGSLDSVSNLILILMYAPVEESYDGRRQQLVHTSRG